MAKAKHIEAHIETPNGTSITLKGSTNDIEKVVKLFAPSAAGSVSERRQGKGKSHSGSGVSGYAEVDEEGKLHIVVSDLKASSQKDATRRLIYVALLARRELLNEPKTDRSTLNEILSSFNLYDGNARRLLASDKGLIRDTDKKIGLSGPAIKKAEEFALEIMDDSIKGKWSPISSERRKTKKKKKKKAK